MTSRERTNAEGRALLRVAREFKEFLEPISHEPEAASLLVDVRVLESVGMWLAHVVPLDCQQGIPCAWSAELPSMGTARAERLKETSR